MAETKATPVFPDWSTGTDVEIQIKDDGVTYKLDINSFEIKGNETIDTFHLFKNKTNATNVVTRLDEEISLTCKKDMNNPFYFYLEKKRRKIKNERQVEVVFKDSGYKYSYTEIMCIATIEPKFTADNVTEYSVTLKMIGDPVGNIMRLNDDLEPYGEPIQTDEELNAWFKEVQTKNLEKESSAKTIQQTAPTESIPTTEEII